MEGDKLINPEPLSVKWDGADPIAGIVMAHAMKVENYDIPAAQLGQQAVSLRDGLTLAIELRVAKAPVVRRPGTNIDVPKDEIPVSIRFSSRSTACPVPASR